MPARKRKTPVAPLPRQVCRAGQFAIYTVMCASGLLWSANSTGLTLMLTLTPPPSQAPCCGRSRACEPDNGVLPFDIPLIGVPPQVLLVRFTMLLLTACASSSHLQSALRLRGRMTTVIHHRPERT